MEPIVLFGVQFTLSLLAYLLIAFWYVVPRLAGLPRELAVAALRARLSAAIALVWLCVVVGMLDTVNAIVQSMRFSVFTYALGVNWVIVTTYVPALLVSSLLIFMQLLRRNRSTARGSAASQP